MAYIIVILIINFFYPYEAVNSFLNICYSPYGHIIAYSTFAYLFLGIIFSLYLIHQISSINLIPSMKNNRNGLVIFLFLIFAHYVSWWSDISDFYEAFWSALIFINGNIFFVVFTIYSTLRPDAADSFTRVFSQPY